MGSIIAKLDSKNKILSIKSNGKKLSNDDIEKIKNYYNNDGVIKVHIDMDQMDLFIQDYMKKLSKTSVNLEAAVKQNMRLSMGLGLLLISNNGFIMSVHNENTKPVEAFDTIETFAEVNENKSTVNKDRSEESLDIFVKKIPTTQEFDISSYKKPVTASKIKPENKEQPHSKSESEQISNDNSISKVPFVDVIIPKILLSTNKSKRIEFIDFITKLFAEDTKTKIIYSSFKQILESIVDGSNPEIKVANLIGLTMRVAIMTGIAYEAKKLGPNNFTEDDMINFTTQVIADFMTDIPADKCTFYNNKLNFIKFTPNICNGKSDKSIKQEVCAKCPECKETKCNCPEAKCPEIKFPEIKCPPIVFPEMKFPPIVFPEMKASNINIPEITCKTISETKCPKVTVPESASVSKPAQESVSKPAQSNMWRIVTIIFVLLVIGLIILMIANNNSENLSTRKISNLTKLNLNKI